MAWTGKWHLVKAGREWKSRGNILETGVSGKGKSRVRGRGQRVGLESVRPDVEPEGCSVLKPRVTRKRAASRRDRTMRDLEGYLKGLASCCVLTFSLLQR